jgi:hypothetical protein
VLWILAFLAMGRSYLLSDVVTRVVALALIGGPALLLAVWLGQHTGTGDLMVDVWQGLSGAQTPAEIGPDCADGDPGAFHLGIWATPMLIANMWLALMILILGVGAMLLVPYGVAWGIVAGVRSAITHQPAVLYAGLRPLLIGIGLTVADGLVMRMSHELSQIGC